MNKYGKQTCFVNLTTNPWFNLAASIVIDAVLAADYNFFNKSYGDDLLEYMGISCSGALLIDNALKAGVCYDD